MVRLGRCPRGVRGQLCTFRILKHTTPFLGKKQSRIFWVFFMKLTSIIKYIKLRFFMLVDNMGPYYFVSSLRVA